jgi:type IV pilus assembly protein PilE
MIRRKGMSGFTLIEALITVAIIGIISSIAYPSYIDFVVQSNRSEGLRELVRIANLQEQYYVDNRSYTPVMTELGLDADPFITEHGHYSIDATVVNDTFTLVATAKGTQASKDSACGTISVTNTGKKTPASNCWE